MDRSLKVVRNAPRVLGMGMVFFLSLFALDAFQGEGGSGELMLDFLLHLVPALVCLSVVLLSWKRNAIGAMAFSALAVAYGLWAMPHWDWIAVISGVLLLVALAYFAAWYVLRKAAHGMP